MLGLLPMLNDVALLEQNVLQRRPPLGLSAQEELQVHTEVLELFLARVLLLDGGPTSPCMAGPDYQAGVDVNGHPVVPADEQASRVPVPDQIAVPLHSGQRAVRRDRSVPGQTDAPYVALDGRRLDPLLNPKPCH